MQMAVTRSPRWPKANPFAKWHSLIGPLGVAAVLLLAGDLGHAAVRSYGKTQADRGRLVYESSCSACHGSTLDGGPGGPPISGPDFSAKWSGQPTGALLQYVREKMPLGAPGSLSDDAYSDVVAFVWTENLGGQRESSSSSPPSSASAGHPVAPVSSPMDPIARAAAAARAATLASVQPVTDQMLQQPPDGEWLMWRRTYESQGFSNLAQINRSNVGDLRVAWSWQLAPGHNEITPLVHDGVLFVVSSGRLDALNAATGELLWEYQRPGENSLVRSLAIYGNLIYLAAQTSVVALDMHTGKVVWDHLVVPPAGGIHFDSGPIAAKGLIFQGMALCVQVYPGGCFIVALNAKTGAQVWRFNTIARPGQPGGDTWNDTPLKERSGASVWMPASYDPKLDLLFIGTGQTYQVGNLIRGRTRAAGLYTDSTLALRPETGKLVWYYQHFAGDVWDMDWAYERVLGRLTVNGAPRETITTGTKLGIFDTLDAATGRYLFSMDAGIQTLVTGIDPITGAKRVDPRALPDPGETRHICPSSLGGRNWMATAYNPDTHVLYVPMNDDCMAFTRLHGDKQQIGATFMPDTGGLIGRLQAFDLLSHKTLWIRRERAAQVSAVLATAGGLIFEGNRDRWFRASDDRSGKVLWQVRLDSSPSSFPITYSVNGVQYVAVVTGGGGNDFVDVLMGQLTPEIVTPNGAATLWIFRLADRR